MDSGRHLTTDNLILFMDRELDLSAVAAAERHLQNCGDCAKRLRMLQGGSSAYGLYREQVLNQALKPDGEWQPLKRSRGTLASPALIWWSAAAALIAVALMFAWPRFSAKQPTAQDILARAAVPADVSQRTLLLSGSNFRFERPALLSEVDSTREFVRVKALFVKAHYNWQNPLSARSFAAWRNQLPDKKDLVTSIQEPGGMHLYRVRTRTNSGILRSASLTLQAVDYRPTRAGFEFVGEEPMELSEQREPAQARRTEVQPPNPLPLPRAAETIAGPEDELRVFAALNSIGADAEEPIDVKLDADHHHVLVTGMGMSAARRKEVEGALALLPNTIVRFSAGQPRAAMADQPAATDGEVQDGIEEFRKLLQDRAGGVRRLQIMTDSAIDTTNGMFAHAHALRVLAQEFPPAVEEKLGANGKTTLLMLRQRHVGAMDYALRHLKEELQPLMADEAKPGSKDDNPGVNNWQNGATSLYEANRNLDNLVSRLLSGTYSRQAGEQMLKELPGNFATVETLIRIQNAVARE